MRRIVLASASAARQRLLTAAGVAFELADPKLDEAAIKARELARGATVRALAETLAKAKALGLADAGALVIGADQTLDLDGRCIDKATSAMQLEATLLALRGREHALHSAVAIADGGQVVWSHVETARLRVRDFSDTFLRDYLARHGERVRSSLGGYWFEAEGVQLFDHVVGDYFTILGLPLMPLLSYLRGMGALAS